MLSGLISTMLLQIATRGLARTFQHGRVFANLSLVENVLISAHTRLRAVRPPVPALGPLAELTRSNS
jgi:branched-chain amino acid transport system ATP-binding protein